MINEATIENALSGTPKAQDCPTWLCVQHLEARHVFMVFGLLYHKIDHCVLFHAKSEGLVARQTDIPHWEVLIIVHIGVRCSLTPMCRTTPHGELLYNLLAKQHQKDMSNILLCCLGNEFTPLSGVYYLESCYRLLTVCSYRTRGSSVFSWKKK